MDLKTHHLGLTCEALTPLCLGGRRAGSREDRLRFGVVIPYQVRGSGRGYTLYERIDMR